MEPDFERLILGELGEAERDRLEARLLAEPQLLAQADAVEAELVDAYARNELSPDRRRVFEERLRVSPRLQDRLAFAQTLRAASPADIRHAKLLRGRWAWLAAPSRAWIPAMAAVLATVAAGWLAVELSRIGGERDLLRAERDVLEAERSRQLQAHALAERRIADLRRSLEQAQSARTPAPARRTLLAVFALGLGAARDDTRPAPLSVPRAADAVRLELDLEGAEVYDLLKAVVSTEAGVVVFTGDGLKPERVEGVSTVAVTVPARRLSAGRYLVALEGRLRSGGSETAALREFQIVRRR